MLVTLLTAVAAVAAAALVVAATWKALTMAGEALAATFAAWDY